MTQLHIVKSQWLKKMTNSTSGQWLVEVLCIFWSLAKVMVPMLFIIRLIELMGWIDILAHTIEPMMIWVGLPGELGLVWASTMISNIYTGMAVFYQLGIAHELTVAQVSVLGIMMLIAHSLPIEVAIAKSAGVSVIFSLLLRIVAAFLLGLLVHLSYLYTTALQEPLALTWQPETTLDQSWYAWLILQLQTMLAAFLIISALTLLIRALRYIGIERMIHWLLTPILRLIHE